MPGSCNKFVGVGNLTRDPEIRYVGSGAAVTKFTIAINAKSKSSEDTTYVDIVAWDKLAEACNTYLCKGSSVLVEGRLSIRSYPRSSSTRCRCSTRSRATTAPRCRPVRTATAATSATCAISSPKKKSVA